MYIEKNIVLKRKNNKPILIDTFYQVTKENQPIVIFCHGYKGFKDWGAWNLMAETIAKSSFCFIKFNFSHNGGTLEQPIDFPDLDAFGNNNYTKELDDLGDVIDWTVKHFKEKSFVNTSEIYLIGHSRGGGISILKAVEDSRIRKLITLASVCDFEKRMATIDDLDQWKKDGVKYVANGRTKQQMPHYYQFYEDFIQNKNRLNIEAACKKMKVPNLIIHGDADTSISVSEAEKIHQWNPSSQFSVIEDANHVFNTKHPWEENHLSNALKKICQLIVEFIA
ncbi:MAG: alpha/beta fold hydrolase [Winogradskyella sp.]|uniref:alpha/beta hydrolase family protein n=1 Tax=Winogradskyella sp. TaxID=1883156 RepID=UPI0017FD070E|nr:alpha/beta hydrolase [Winogradskyella sp.]MBT8246139.1 alpha/beta hydrolase [Winogradskyella sp.]NNK23727.1 alpha/beta fold hydrolase [Winogradskyella sp.]